MNIKKIQDLIKKEETEYFNSKKDYSEFSKHFSFKPFFERNGMIIAFLSLLGGIGTLPIILFILIPVLGLDYSLLGFFLSSFLFLFVCISPLFISYFVNNFINHNTFFRTQKNIKNHEQYIENKMMPYFDELNVSDNVLNTLKVELSDDQFINLMMDNSNPSYQDLKKWLHKETKIENLKDIKRNVILTFDEIKEYSKNHDEVKLNTI